MEPALTPRDVYTVVDDAVPDEDLTTDQLGSRIVALSGRLAAATCRWLLLVAEFDARNGAAHLGLASTAHWLRYACGVAHRTAVEHVRIARSLHGWARLAEEMTAGRLSYSHVRAISRIATGAGAKDDPATAELVESLIETARHGTVGQLEVVVRGLRDINDAEDLPPQRSERERVSQAWTARSQWRLSARLDPERGAEVAAALRAIETAEGLCAADALVRLAEIGLAALADGGRPRELRGDERAAIVVHVDAAAVPQPEQDHHEPPAPPVAARSRERGRPAFPKPRPFGQIAGGPGLPAAVIERLACAGRVRLAVRDGGSRHSDVLDLGRSHRVVTGRQLAALRLRDGGTCRYPGCTNSRALQAHHVRHWLYGGPTDLDNLILICEAHHQAHHHGEFAIVPLERGRFAFRRGGCDLPATVDPARLVPDPWARLEDEHDGAPPDAAESRWDGSRMQRAYAIDTIAQDLRVLRARNTG